MSVWLIAIPATADSGSQQARFMWMTGQSETSTAASQRALSPSSIDFGLFSNLSTEFVVIQHLIIKQSGLGWTIEESIRVEGTRAQTVSSPSGNYLTSVSVDGTTIGGDGTPGDPLKATGTRYSFQPAFQFDSNFLNYRAQGISGTGAQRGTFKIPEDAVTIPSIKLVVAAGSTMTDQSIELTTSFGKLAEAISSDSDLLSLFSIPVANQWTAFELIGKVFAGVEAGDICGIFVDHKSIGVTLSYIGVLIEYTV
jgi:hypothetical protein